MYLYLYLYTYLYPATTQNKGEARPSAPPPPPSRAPEFAAKIFAEGGWLHAGLSLEHRPQQETMARTIAAVLKSDAPLLFEAGTGVGKSLAYLVPGLIHAIDTSRQLIVSTHTISLQEQLETSDLPKCRRLFKSTPTLARYAEFKSAVLVGKSNYLCTTRLGHAAASFLNYRACDLAVDDIVRMNLPLGGFASAQRPGTSCSVRASSATSFSAGSSTATAVPSTTTER
jgi:Rad3-related DNA helicase